MINFAITGHFFVFGKDILKKFVDIIFRYKDENEQLDIKETCLIVVKE
jgi:hypothetical protein